MKILSFTGQPGSHQLPWLAWVIALLLLPIAESTAANDVEIIDHKPWHDYFGGQETVFRFGLSAVRPVEGLLTWRFVVFGATGVRGEQPLVIDAAQPLTVDISLRLPEPKPGVIVDALLEIAVIDDSDHQSMAVHEKKVRIYPNNPFYEQTVWLEQQDIHLFDPENTIADQLTELGVPFTPVSNLAALQDCRDGILIVGEAISFRDYRGLFAETLVMASRGMRVLCLAPAAGEIELPGMGASSLPHPYSIRFHGPEIISHYDKKLDHISWPPDGRIVAAGINLEGARGKVLGQVERQAGAWPWIEFEYANGGRLILCGLAIMEKWDATPTPRFLLFEIVRKLRSP